MDDWRALKMDTGFSWKIQLLKWIKHKYAEHKTVCYKREALKYEISQENYRSNEIRQKDVTTSSIGNADNLRMYRMWIEKKNPSSGEGAEETDEHSRQRNKYS